MNVDELNGLLQEIVHASESMNDAVKTIPEKGEDELLNYAKVTEQVVARFRAVVMKRIESVNIDPKENAKLISYHSEPDKKASDLFKIMFDAELKDFCDILGSCTVGTFMFAAYRFNSYLVEKYGDYESEGKSMIDIVEEKYGKQAIELLKTIV